MHIYYDIVKVTLNQITNLLVLLLLISFITSVTTTTHAQYSYDIRPPTVNPNPGGPTVNTTSDVASNSTVNVQQQNSSTGSTP